MQAASGGFFSLRTSFLLFRWNFCWPCNQLPTTITGANSSVPWATLAASWCELEAEESRTRGFRKVVVDISIWGKAAHSIRGACCKPFPTREPTSVSPPEEKGGVLHTLQIGTVAFVLLNFQEPPIPGT